MLDPSEALAAAWRPTNTRAGVQRPQRVLVIGAAGVLGSAVLESLLTSHRFERVGVVVTQPLKTAMRGLVTLADEPAAWQAMAPQEAVVVFDRERRSHGREDAYRRVLPAELPALALQLQLAGVKRLLVALPHRAAMLPQALRQGLATLDETAVAALGFEQLVFMRLAEAPSAGSTTAQTSWLQRLADGVLSQLHWMIPSAEQAVRASTVAQVVRELLLAWPQAQPATRLLPQALLWNVAQGGDARGLVEQWLRGESLPSVRAARQRW